MDEKLQEMTRRQLLVLFDVFDVLGLCFCDCEFAQGPCVFSFAVIVLGAAKREMLGIVFEIIFRSHYAGMCVLVSHCIAAYRLRINSGINTPYYV